VDLDIFSAKNPWRQGVVPDAPAIERSSPAPLVAALGDPSVTLLLGARAAGKTTLLLHVIREAVERRLAAPQDVFHFDLDTMACGDVLASNRSLLDFVGPSRKPRIVVIDEAQRLPNPGLLLKSVHDLHLPIKLLATGSSSLELRSRIRESLAGRRQTFHLWPLSPSEWLAYCRDEAAKGLRHYRTWGGYPAVARESDPARRGAYLAELLRAYLDRDIEDFLRVERLDAFEGLLRVLARQAGQLVNLNEIAATLQLSRDTVQRYLRYLQETFVVRVVPPFFRNLRSELTKMPKVYFADLGLRNLLAGELHPTIAPPAGSVDENLVFVALLSL
jgi:predicted AAA+ superfamily ATPase